MQARIRQMRPDDVGAAADVVLRGNWGDRREFFAFATRQPECRPIVAELDGTIVGSAVGTVNGPVGWLGAVFVAPEARGGGLGGALTDRLIEDLEAAGCRSLVLVATSAGRPIYERRGFTVAARYRTFEAAGTTAVPDPRLRPFATGDLGGMAALDAAQTGEDRFHLLRAFANPASTRVLPADDGGIAGFVVRAPWGGGATIAASADDAMRILEGRLAASGPAKRVRAGVLDVNEDGVDRLVAAGWQEAWDAPRMHRGDPLDWRPEGIWGQFNHAIG